MTHAVPSSGQRPNMGTLLGSYPRSSPSRKAIYDDCSLALALHFLQAPVFRRSALTLQQAPEKRDYMRRYRKLVALPLILAAMGLVHPGTARGQASALSEEANIRFGNATERTVCEESNADQSVQAAFRLVCLRDLLGTRKVALKNAIVIGFVGGFVRSDDVKHPEVQFAALLRQRYPSIVHAEVFANHDGKNALRRVLHLLDTDGDSVLTAREKEQASIIIYGHSWGGSQVVTLARQLGQQGVPVLLTIQVDSVHKPGHNDAVIPPNVRNAINFYQTRGLIHGRSSIRAADRSRTDIGNFEMTYRDHRINCDNYPWIARHLNKPHHEIENDPLVWEQIASMINSELSKSTAAVEASSTSTSLGVR